MAEINVPTTITPEEIKRRMEVLLAARQAARTDLLYLCNKLLGYTDVSQPVHGEILNHLQKFTGGTERLSSAGIIGYEPSTPLWKLTGPRNNLILFPRGHLKTSIITIAHTIQWILNYPDIRVALSMAIGDQTHKVMTELKGHFQFNAKFRMVFPDYCPPPKKAADWGNMDEFTTPARSKVRKEPTVCLITIGKVIAGSHYDVIKHSDLVDQNNVKTPNQIAEVKSHFGYMNPLVERYSIAKELKDVRHGWQDVEGTIYDFGDLHVGLAGGSDSVYALLEKPSTVVNGWNCLVRDAEKGKNGDTLWPERFPLEELERIRTSPEISPYQYSCQYRNRPIPPEGGLCDPKDIVFIPRQALSTIQPMLRLHCTIDLHGLEPAKNDNDYTVLNAHGFDRDGRLYVVDIRRGRFTPDKVIWHVFDIHQRYPAIVDFKIEKDAHARVLLPFLQREASKRQKFPTMVPIKRDTHVSKQQRIKGLQPWFHAGIIRFADDLTCKTDLILEIMQFPSQSSGVHDDILDTLADAMQNQEGGVTDDVVADLALDPREQFGGPKKLDKFMGFDEKGVSQWLYGNHDEDKVSFVTGVL